MDAKAKACDMIEPGVASPHGVHAVCEAPWFAARGDLWRPTPDGIVTIPDFVSIDHNVVVDQGKGHVLNRAFGGYTKSSAGIFLQLHSATTASNHVWSNISGSQVASYGNNVPLITFATTYTAGLATATASYGFAAGTQTVSGAAVQFYTTNTMSTNAATADILHYSEGQFAASRQVQANDTLNVTLSVSFA